MVIKFRCNLSHEKYVKSIVFIITLRILDENQYLYIKQHKMKITFCRAVA